ncbi:type II toxin-antitoxin system HicB family antitoxin [Candidatus Foliamicus sp.]
MSAFSYPVEIERDEDGRHVIFFPDFGWGATDGATRAEALAEAQDLLRELIVTTMREDRDLPEPSRSSNCPAQIEAPISIVPKAFLYKAVRETGVSPCQLAHDLNVDECEVRRMLNPDHATRAAEIDRALRWLGECARAAADKAL